MARAQGIAKEAWEQTDSSSTETASEEVNKQLGKCSGRPQERVAACPAFFIGDESDSELCRDASDTESYHRLSRRLSLEVAFDALSTTTSSSVEDNMHEGGTKQLELSNFQCSAIRDLLATFSEEMLGFRQELKSLDHALHNERRERVSAFKHSEAKASKFTSAVLAHLGRISQKRQRSSPPDLEQTRTCIASIDSLSSALENETKERVALEASVQKVCQELRGLDDALDSERRERLAAFQNYKVFIASIDELSCALENETRDRVVLEESLHQALQEIQEGFEQVTFQQDDLVKDLEHSLDRKLTLFKESVSDRISLQDSKGEPEAVGKESGPDRVKSKESEALGHQSGLDCAEAVMHDLDQVEAGSTSWSLWNMISTT